MLFQNRVVHTKFDIYVFIDSFIPFAVLASFPITLFELYAKKKSGERVLKLGN
jgi:hypothetical protein